MVASQDGERAFGVTLERADGRCVVVVRGEVDMDTAEDLGRVVECVRRSGAPLVIDLAHTTFMDSSGINLLLRAHAAYGGHPDAVTLRAPSEAVMVTLTLAGVTSLLRIEGAATAPPPLA